MTPRYSVSPDGEHMTIHVDCGPLVPEHVIQVEFPKLWELASQCRARQLGVDGKGDL